MTSRTYRESNEEGNEDGADGVGNHPAEQMHEDGADDDAHRTQSVRNNVQEHALHKIGINRI